MNDVNISNDSIRFQAQPQGQQGNISQSPKQLPTNSFISNVPQNMCYRGSVGVPKLSNSDKKNKSPFLEKQTSRSKLKSQTAIVIGLGKEQNTSQKTLKSQKKVSEKIESSIESMSPTPSNKEFLASEETSFKQSNLKLKCNILVKKILESNQFQFMIHFLTSFVLFSDDLKIIFFTKQQDSIFDSLTISILVIFTIEFILTRIYFTHSRDLVLSILEAISIFSLIVDIEKLKIEMNLSE